MAKSTVAYRLFRIKDDSPEVLFHSFKHKKKKTKKVPLNKWMRAEEKEAWNPGKKQKGKSFTSGWHVVLSEEEIQKYLTRFKNTKDIRICKIYVRDVRDKPRSQVKLARWMFVKDNDWKKAKEE